MSTILMMYVLFMSTNDEVNYFGQWLVRRITWSATKEKLTATQHSPIMTLPFS